MQATRLVVVLALLSGLFQAPPAAAQDARELLLFPGHPEWSTPTPDRFRVRFVTSEGEFVLEVHRRWAPRGADRFYNLVRLGYYDDTRISRVRDGDIAQFGLSGDPAVNAAWYGNAMPDDPPRRSNLRGTVAFASLEPSDTRTTQLYINLADNTHLDEMGFAPLARVIEGMDVVDRFYAGYDESAGGGMRGGKQGPIVTGGNAWLDAEYPLLTRIESARVEDAQVLRYPDPGANRIRVEAHLLPAVSTGPMDPDWSPDGRQLAVSMRGDLWVLAADGRFGDSYAVVAGPGHQIQPTPSPDGATLAFVSPVRGRLGTGGLWTIDLSELGPPAGEALSRATLVHYTACAGTVPLDRSQA